MLHPARAMWVKFLQSGGGNGIAGCAVTRQKGGETKDDRRHDRAGGSICAGHRTPGKQNKEWLLVQGERARTSFVLLIATLWALTMVRGEAQETPPSLRAGALTSNIAIDGRLNEPAWDSVPSTDALTQ